MAKNDLTTQSRPLPQRKLFPKYAHQFPPPSRRPRAGACLKPPHGGVGRKARNVLSGRGTEFSCGNPSVAPHRSGGPLPCIFGIPLSPAATHNYFAPRRCFQRAFHGRTRLIARRMYQSDYGLNELPFNITPAPKFLYLSPTQQEALQHLNCGAQKRKGVILGSLTATAAAPLESLKIFATSRALQPSPATPTRSTGGVCAGRVRICAASPIEAPLPRPPPLP